MSFPAHLKIVVWSTVKQFKINETMITERILSKRDVELTKLLSQTLKFSYELLTPEDGEAGRRLSNDSWTGMVGMMLRGDADLVVSVLSLTEERSKILDFTYPYHRERMTFVTRKPEYIPDPTVFLKPFSIKVWICVLLSFIFITLVFHKIFSKKYSLKNLFFVCYSTLLRQNICIHSQRVSDLIIISSWCVGCMFLSFCYSAVLLSFLTFPPLSGVRTIPELASAVAQDKYECTTFPGTFIPDALATSNDPNAKIIGRNMLLNRGSTNIDTVLKNSIPLKKAAFVVGESFFNPSATSYFVSEDEFFPALQAIWMRKSFCCKKHLNYFVSSLWNSGIYRKIIYGDLFVSNLKTLMHSGDIKDRKNERSLVIDDFKGAFIILIGGYTLAIIVFLLEISVIPRLKSIMVDVCLA